MLNIYLVNPFSVATISIFIILLLATLLISAYRDFTDRKSLRYINSDYYDIIQHHLTIFTKEKFHEKYNVFKLYLYIIRVRIISFIFNNNM